MSDLPIDPKTQQQQQRRLAVQLRLRPRPRLARNAKPTATCQTDGPTQKGEAVVATISLGGHAGEIAISPDGNQVYVIAADSVKVINRLHHIVGTYRIGPHPKSILVSDDGTRVYVTGYDGSTSVISTADRHGEHLCARTEQR